MVELIQHGDDLGALVLAGGRTTFHELGLLAPIAARVDALRFALERLARIGGSAASEISLRSAQLHLDELQRLIGVPLRARVMDRAAWCRPRPRVASVALELDSRPRTTDVGGAFCVALAQGRYGRLVTEGHVTVVAGPGLPGAEAEARRIAEFYPGSSLLVGPDATVDAVGAALDGARIAHIAAHGTVRRDNPRFSTIELIDGPAVVHDLERISRPPTVIVLASCNSAIGQLHSSNDVVGLAAALLAARCCCRSSGTASRRRDRRHDGRVPRSPHRRHPASHCAGRHAGE